MNFFEKMMEISPATILPVPADYMAGDTVGWFFTIFAGGFAFLILPWTFYKLVKEKDAIPLLMWIGGTFASLMEAMFDNVGHLWYPTDLPGPVYVGFGVHVPGFMPFSYCFFMGMTGYLTFRLMKQGLSMEKFFTIWLVLCLSDIFCEMPGTATGAYTYYGDVPFKILGFPLAWSWINGTAMMMGGFMLWLVAPYLKGWRKAAIILIPAAGMGGIYGVAGWPYFAALNWPIPVYATWLLTLFSLAMCLIVIRFIAAVVVQPSAYGPGFAFGSTEKG